MLLSLLTTNSFLSQNGSVLQLFSINLYQTTTTFFSSNQLATMNPILSITIADPQRVYGPGDTVNAEVRYETAQTIPVEEIIASLSATCRVCSSIDKRHVVLHRSWVMVYDDKENAEDNQLTTGANTWNIEFKLPEENTLPASFLYGDAEGAAEVAYSLRLALFQTDNRPRRSDHATEIDIRYWPTRVPNDSLDIIALELTDTFQVKKYDDTPMPLFRTRRTPRFVQNTIQRNRIGQEQISLTLWLPRHAAFNATLDISLKLVTAAVEVRLVSVEYHFDCYTRIVVGTQARQTRHRVTSRQFSTSTLLEGNGQWLSLQRHAPFMVHSSFSSIYLGPRSFTTLGPNFAGHQISRDYSLGVDLFLEVYGNTYRVPFEEMALIMLP